MLCTDINYRLCILLTLIFGSVLPAVAAPDSPLPGFRRSPWFHEQVREEWIDPGVRVLINAPGSFDPAWPTDLIVYATPNGNTIEQTLGSALTTGTDWHFDIQHIAAQTRQLRAVTMGKNIVLACLQADTRSWPAWRQKTPDNAVRIRGIVETLKAKFAGTTVSVTLTGHSGGGSFLFGYLNSAETVPDYVDRIAFLDANYSYSDTDRHGEKLLAWLQKDKANHLDVIVYDDRNIMLDGKKVVGPDGGTFRATERMTAFFGTKTKLTVSRTGMSAPRPAWTGRFSFVSTETRRTRSCTHLLWEI